jgi:hypothetical protein
MANANPNQQVLNNKEGYYMFILSLLASSIIASNADELELETPLLPPDAHLVKARVVRVDEGKDHAADFVIEYIYAGDPALKGQHFTLADYLRRGGSQVNKPLPLRVEGEVGLWWVGRRTERSPETDREEVKLFSYHDLWHPFPAIYYPFPAVLKGGKTPDRFEQNHYGDLKTDPYDFGPDRMVQWAEAIEKTYGTKGDDEKIALLKKYAGSDNPPLSAWAISMLSRFLDAEGKRRLFTSKGELRRDYEILLDKSDSLAKHVRKDVKSMLERFVDDDKLPIYAQTELDGVLSRIEDDWGNSDLRKKLLQRWEKVKDPVDRYFIDSHLGESDKKGDK